MYLNLPSRPSCKHAHRPREKESSFFNKNTHLRAVESSTQLAQFAVLSSREAINQGGKSWRTFPLGLSPKAESAEKGKIST
jgi:hypothetical protein